MGWGAIIGSVLGSLLGQKNPEIQDVKRKESVLSSPSSLQNNSGGGSGFAALLSNMGGKKKNKGQDWSGSSDDMWLNNRP